MIQDDPSSLDEGEDAPAGSGGGGRGLPGAGGKVQGEGGCTLSFKIIS